jgi:NADH-quinone oxidoreductase subunit E
MVDRLDEIFSSYEKRADSLIPILQDVQEEFGYLPEEAMIGIAKAIGVPESRVYAVASFYAQFRFTPMGKNHVMVCRGTACHVRGAARILEEAERNLGIKEGETTEDLEYTLETVACIGCCGLAPTLVINETTYGRLTPKDIGKIFDERKETKE